MRKWRPPDVKPDEEWQVVHQIVVPQVYRQEIIKLVYDTPMAGHLGVKKNKLQDSPTFLLAWTQQRCF